MTAPQSLPQSLDDKRVAIVNEHMRLENAYDFPSCVGTFGRAQYQLIADGELYDGADRVHYFLAQNHTAFPDFIFEPTRVSPTTGAVVVEGRFVGTQLGPWRGLPPTGRKVDFQMCLLFEFDGESMTNEKIYFDLNTPLRQLGIADDYNSTRGKLSAVLGHPIVILKALIFSLTHRRVRQIYQGYRKPAELLNPLFANKVAIRLFTVHIVVVSCDLFIIGPLALAYKSTLYYWGGRSLLVISALPIAAFLNRNPQTFGGFIGRWVMLRNFFEYGIHIVFAAAPLSWFRYYPLLWWIVAYRYLDVGPRRLLQRLYDTPEKQAARPWAQYLNWVTIVAIYIGAFFAVFYKQILFASVPSAATHLYVPAHWEVGVVIGVDFALALWTWIAIRQYSDSLLAAAGVQEKLTAAHY